MMNDSFDQASRRTSQFEKPKPPPDETPVAAWEDTVKRVSREHEDTHASAGRENLPEEDDAALPFGRLGDCRIVRRLGRGGMGDVYLAHDESLDRPVAVKVLPPELARQSDFLTRFRTEASAVAKLVHPNVVQVYSFREDQGHYFFVMQYVEGETLAQHLTRKGPLDVEQAVRIAEQCLVGLAAAHDQGLVHRDVKPRNILLDRRREQALLADFGLVKTMGHESGVTATGIILGTADYMSPEQAQSLSVDTRTDLYSMGVVLYEMLSGQLPFQADTPTGMLLCHTMKTPRPLKEVAAGTPPALAAIVSKLLKKDPDLRYQTAREVLDDMRALDEQGAVAPSRKHGLWLLPLGLVACLTVGMLLWSPWKQVGQNTAGPKLSSALPEPSSAEPDAPPDVSQKVPAIHPTAILPFQVFSTADEDLGKDITAILFASLVANPELYLVEREEIDKLFQEQALNLTGMVAANQATQIGHLTGAKILVTGSVVQVDQSRTITAKIIGTETGRVLGRSVTGRTTDELAPLIEQLAAKVEAVISTDAGQLVAKQASRADHLRILEETLGSAKRPTVFIHVTEQQVGATVIDRAAETELILCCQELGFEVIDPNSGSAEQADVIVRGEALSELAARHGDLISVKARVQIKATDRVSGSVLAGDRRVAVVVDLTEQIAGKSALQKATLEIARRMLPKVVNEWNELNVRER